MTELVYESIDEEMTGPIEGESVAVLNEKRVYAAEMSHNKKAQMTVSEQ